MALQVLQNEESKLELKICSNVLSN